ncbi:MAG: clan AA aspartic protease [Candidatus Bathyarchaeia archaeon]
MSAYFLNSTPVLKLVLENPLMDVRYPREGEILAVIDTGYEGFALIPESIFKQLLLHQLAPQRRQLILADGSTRISIGTYAKLVSEELGLSLDGFVETFEAVEETTIGMEFLRNVRLELDYCTDRIEISRCP